MPEEVERQLASLRFRQMALKPLLPIEQARHAVIDAQARLAVTPISNDLAIALEATQRVLAERLQKRDLFEKLGVEISKLEERLQAAQQRVRIENATQADERLQAAQQEYRQASLTCGRAFRRFVDAVRRSSNTPGAAVSRFDYSLHLPGITPASWIGTTGQAMNEGRLPFEED